ncbi:UNVERIFIED_CONTAM: hypothetical protein KB573_05525 [Streptococcus canis]|uniref:hypothetical protein n=1 Tax=Streptococcus canis TaxID=1329 RepID=UPI0011437FAD|nr:hypothetical protein [Streptococcus canis]MDV6021868.1 hypothetical protein [Streptococcus canis]GEE07363.1 hypothetical protein ScOT1_14560 [Streptococcus canis]
MLNESIIKFLIILYSHTTRRKKILGQLTLATASILLFNNQSVLTEGAKPQTQNFTIEVKTTLLKLPRQQLMRLKQVNLALMSANYRRDFVSKLVNHAEMPAKVAKDKVNVF